MIFRPRHAASVSAAAAPDTGFAGSSATSLSLDNGGRRHSGSGVLPPQRKLHGLPPSNEVSSKKKNANRRQPETRAKAWVLTGRQVRICACSAGGFIMMFLIMFVWCRAMAMSVVPSAGGGASAPFTVLVNTFKRPTQLEEAVRHYAMCDGVESVRVAWSEESPPPDPATSPQLFAHPRPVKFHTHSTTSINNRFITPPKLLTEAVFVVDDDIAVPCNYLSSAFKTWESHPDTLVGFFPRSHRPPNKQSEDLGAWEYLYFWRVVWNMEYSIILTKAAFLNVKYLELYSGVASDNDSDESNSAVWSAGKTEAMVQARSYVDSHQNCEDIAMQMVVTLVSKRPPVAVFAPITDTGLFGGISTRKGSGKWWAAEHAKERSRCLADLHDIFCNVASPVDPSLGAWELQQTHNTVEESAEGPLPLCQTLLQTNLFAVAFPGDYALSGGGVRGAVGDSKVENFDRDLSRLSRWGLAVRAPTLADFFSADMVLLPGKIWKWLAKDDFLGRPPKKK